VRTLFNDLKKIDGLVVSRDVSLADKTTFRIGGVASILVQPRTISALEKTLEYFANNHVRFDILGNGSNLLVDDSGVGVVLSLALLSSISMENGRLCAGAGCRLMSLAAWSMRCGIGGFEEFSGIPASLGGAARMNAGTPVVSFADTVRSVRISGPGGSFYAGMDELQTGYRSCCIPSGSAVSEIVFNEIGAAGNSKRRYRLMRTERKDIVRRTRSVLAKRHLKQPIGTPNAGCVFKNPPGKAAGFLIEQCGFKGKRVGDARVSDIHANFIVNLGNATFDHVIALMELVRAGVMEQTGICLEPEVRIWRKRV
jgi:UDP-N-acetylmuramate dehydrogenase